MTRESPFNGRCGRCANATLTRITGLPSSWSGAHERSGAVARSDLAQSNAPPSIFRARAEPSISEAPSAQSPPSQAPLDGRGARGRPRPGPPQRRKRSRKAHGRVRHLRGKGQPVEWFGCPHGASSGRGSARGERPPRQGACHERPAGEASHTPEGGLHHDSARVPPPSGVRGASLTAQVVYHAQEFAVELRVSRTRSRQMVIVVGQITDLEQPARRLGGIPVQLCAGNRITMRAVSNAWGEFYFEADEQDDMWLEVAAEKGRSMRIPLRPRLENTHDRRRQMRRHGSDAAWTGTN